jgi:hypothetical protein
MMRRLVLFTLILAVALTTGCSYFQKPEPPPPLPPIEEPKPPLKMKSEYFNSFPWEDLSKPQETGNEPDTWTYTFKEGDTLESVAEKQMGDGSMADRLASYNDLTSPSTVTPGKTIVIPDPIIGASSKIMVKHKGEKEFGTPEPFGVEFKKGDEYKFRFETNVDGHLYVFRRGPKGVLYLYPERIMPPKKPKRGKRDKTPEPSPITRESKVKKHEPVDIPLGVKGFRYDPKKVGEQLFVFLSLKEIPSLEELKGKTKIRPEDLEDVMRRVKVGEVFDKPPYHLLRITDPSEILGFKLNIDG